MDPSPPDTTIERRDRGFTLVEFVVIAIRAITREHVEMLPAMGFSANRYELALIDAGLLEQVSTTYDLRADGTVVTNGQPCT